MTGMPNGESKQHCWAMVVILGDEVLNGMDVRVVFCHRRIELLCHELLPKTREIEISRSV